MVSCAVHGSRHASAMFCPAASCGEPQTVLSTSAVYVPPCIVTKRSMTGL